MHVTERQRIAADNLSQSGMTIKKALMDAGYSEATSSRGIEGVPKRVIRLLAKKGIRLKELGTIDAETQEQLVRGRLVYNTIKGKDSGVLSAKALGSDRRVNMFTPDVQTGVVVISVPTPAIDEKPKILGAQEE